MAVPTRPYQVVVFGATGFVGNLVCEQLLRDYQGKLSFAAAGRSRSKLEELRTRLSNQYSGAKSMPLIVADAADATALESMTAQTQCLLSLSGPYAKFGSKAVAACIKTKTHWCDLTAEVPWIQDMISKHHEDAKAAGVKIVTCCGFDSIPADIGAFFMAEHIRQKLNRQAQDHETVLARLTGGGISGGTAASLVGILGMPASERASANHPYALCPPGTSGRDGGDDKSIGFNRALKRWTFPSPFQVCDNRIVRRSSFLLGGYGEDYSTRETAGAPGLISAILITLFLAAFLVLLSVPFLRSLIARRVLPQSGQGPFRKAMVSGKQWKARYVTTAVPKQGSGSPADVQTVLGTMTGAEGDPGYWDTATMIIECAICLATQDKDLQVANRLQGGVLTTASAFGWVLIDRLKARGFGFSIDSTT
ncbi:hypothetical protein WJX73_004728 [Symbiochloris irregularis]|uniref:Saccharopine dehydrogenase NADP binding domain-containing protein n=1 Tax=Symbiochloris irregularis TaxID=706552 RepID=A0AAW1PN52_9CHLO